MENLIEDLLKCAICNQTFEGTPIILSCCESNVCQHHVEENGNEASSNKRKLFTCILCEKTHELENSKKFATNKTIEKLLCLRVKETNLGEIFSKTSNEIKKLQLSFLKINDFIKDPKNYIYDTISKLKEDVDLRREDLKKKIDDISIAMIDKLDNYQKDCFDNIGNTNLEERTKEILDEIETNLDAWTKDNKQLIIFSNDLKRKEIRSQVLELELKAFKHLSELKEELMMNKTWIYRKNEMLAKDFEKELIQLDG